MILCGIGVVISPKDVPVKTGCALHVISFGVCHVGSSDANGWSEAWCGAQPPYVPA